MVVDPRIVSAEVDDVSCNALEAFHLQPRRWGPRVHRLLAVQTTSVRVRHLLGSAGFRHPQP